MTQQYIGHWGVTTHQYIGHWGVTTHLYIVHSPVHGTIRDSELFLSHRNILQWWIPPQVTLP